MVGFIRLIERRDGIVGGLSVLIFRFVVKQCHVKWLYGPRLLASAQNCGRSTASVSVPVHNKGGNSHVMRLLNLLAEHPRSWLE